MIAQLVITVLQEALQLRSNNVQQVIIALQEVLKNFSVLLANIKMYQGKELASHAARLNTVLQVPLMMELHALKAIIVMQALETTSNSLVHQGHMVMQGL